MDSMYANRFPEPFSVLITATFDQSPERPYAINEEYFLPEPPGPCIAILILALLRYAVCNCRV